MTPQHFEQFWKEYPRKVSRSAAEKKFLKIPVENFEKIMKALKSYKQSEQWRDGKYVPHASTWLHQERWLDDIEESNKAVETFNREYPKPTRGEMVMLYKSLQKFKQKEVNGKLLSPFDQYLIKEGITGQYSKGQIYCINPVAYDKLSKVNAQMESLIYYRWRESLNEEQHAEHWKQIRQRFPLKKEDLMQKLAI